MDELTNNVLLVSSLFTVDSVNIPGPNYKLVTLILFHVRYGELPFRSVNSLNWSDIVVFLFDLEAKVTDQAIPIYLKCTFFAFDPNIFRFFRSWIFRIYIIYIYIYIGLYPLFWIYLIPNTYACISSASLHPNSVPRHCLSLTPGTNML